ncbi:MAG: ABC transporter ATP-binding protein [Aureliella sp.]
MNSAISVRQVTKRYRRNLVLDRLNLEVPQGVVFALLGDNGVGKSTLIRGLLGYHKFNYGEISVLGYDPIKDARALRRKVGYVADNPGLYEWMTVGQAGWYASAFYADGFLDRYDQMAFEFGLPQDAKIRTLSKGMKAKVALSLAMAFEPELLLLDEPTSGLDPVVRRAFMESMIDRAAAGQTVFLSSHQIQDVERVADWVAIVSDGKAVVVAPLDELKSQVSILSYALKDPLLSPPAVEDHVRVLKSKQSGRVIEMTVMGEVEAILSELKDNENCFDVRSIRPNLEELYVAFTQPKQVAVPSTTAKAFSEAANESVA